MNNNSEENGKISNKNTLAKAEKEKTQDKNKKNLLHTIKEEYKENSEEESKVLNQKKKRRKLKQENSQNVLNDIPITFKKGTSPKHIVELLKEHGSFSKDALPVATGFQPDTIRKTLKRMERQNIIVRTKTWGGDYSITLTRYARNRLGLNSKRDTPRTQRKLARTDNLSLTRTMFNESTPRKTEVEGQYADIKEIRKLTPNAGKSLNTTRMNGIYHHGNTPYAVYNLKGSDFWRNSTEKATKEYIQNIILNRSMPHGIFFIPDYDYALKILKPLQFGMHSRITAETCYNKMYLVPSDNYGMEQLRLFRTYENTYEKFVEISLEPEEVRLSTNGYIDGVKDGINTAVMFDGDIVKLSSIIDLYTIRIIDNINILCYDFQLDFYREALKNLPNTIFNSFSIQEVSEVIEDEI